MHKVILNFGEGDLTQGYIQVLIQLWTQKGSVLGQWTGDLPANPDLKHHLDIWQDLYRSYYQNLEHPLRLELEESGVSFSRKQFDQSCEDLLKQLNTWLETGAFPSLDQQLQQFQLSVAEPIQVLIVSNDTDIRLLPWHGWSFFERFPQAWFTFGLPTFRQDYRQRGQTGDLKVLSICGCPQQADEAELNLVTDQLTIQQLPHIQELRSLEEPTRMELSDQLWQQNWDILLFSGHSQTISDQGYIRINKTDRLSLREINAALSRAVAHGLQLAVFNSCDGLGLAAQLEALLLPQAIVMKAAVPDEIASTFLQYFLEAFAQNQHRPIYLALRDAQERLTTLEHHYPCASWLPALCQNPAISPLTWATLRQLPPRPQRLFPSLKRVIAVSILATSLVMGGRWFGLLEAGELALYDHLMQTRPAETIDPRILLVNITAAETNKYGYPLNDEIVAQALQNLGQHQPRAIGLDLHRQQPRGQGRQDFIRQLQQNPNILLVCSTADVHQSYAPPQELTAAQRWNQVGFSDLLIDPVDTGVRRQLLSYDPKLLHKTSSCTTPYSFSLHLAARFLEAEGVEATVNETKNWQFGPVAFERIGQPFGGYQTLDGQSNQILINYRQAPSPAKQVTLAQILADKIDPEEIRDRIVLVGYTAPIARDDDFKTPNGSMAGVWIHAHMLSQILSTVQNQRPQIWVFPQQGAFQWGDWLWCLAWSSLGGFIAWSMRSRSKILMEVMLICILGVLYLVCRALLSQGAWLPLLPSALGTFSTTNGLIVMVIYRAYLEQKVQSE